MHILTEAKLYGPHLHSRLLPSSRHLFLVESPTSRPKILSEYLDVVQQATSKLERPSYLGTFCPNSFTENWLKSFQVVSYVVSVFFFFNFPLRRWILLVCTGSRFDLLAHSSARMSKLWPRETIWTVQLSSGEVQPATGGKTTPWFIAAFPERVQIPIVRILINNLCSSWFEQKCLDCRHTNQQVPRVYVLRIWKARHGLPVMPGRVCIF